MNEPLGVEGPGPSKKVSTGALNEGTSACRVVLSECSDPPARV